MHMLGLEHLQHTHDNKCSNVHQTSSYMFTQIVINTVENKLYDCFQAALEMAYP